MEMTKGELIDLYFGLNTLGELQGAKFAYAVMKNVNILRNEAEAIESAKNPKQDYIQFTREQVALAKKHAVVKDGVPQTYMEDGKSFYAIQDNDKFDKEFEELKKKHQPAIDAYKKQLMELEDLLKEKVEVELYKVSKDLVPETITVKQYASIEAIISDEKSTA